MQLFTLGDSGTYMLQNYGHGFVYGTPIDKALEAYFEALENDDDRLVPPMIDDTKLIDHGKNTRVAYPRHDLIILFGADALLRLEQKRGVKSC